MKNLKITFSKLHEFLTNSLEFEFDKENSDKHQQVYKIGNIKGREMRLVLSGEETRSACRFQVYCYSSENGGFNKFKSACDEPDDFIDKPESAFDINMLVDSMGKMWSLHNDKLDRKFDGMFIGSQNKIEDRAERAANEVTSIIKNSLIPFLAKLK